MIRRHVALLLGMSPFSTSTKTYLKMTSSNGLSNYFLLHNSLRRTHIRPKKVPRKKHSRNAALHPDFYDKVNLWKELLKNEVAADVQEVRDLLINPLADDLERLSQISGPFKLRTNCLHALHGRILVLIHEKSDIHKTMARMSLRPGAPVMLCKFPNLVSISDCIVISCSEVEVVLKAKTTDLDISISDQLVVVPSSGLGYLTALNEFLELKWRDFPGEKLIHYVHCSVPLPVSRPDELYKTTTKLNESQKCAVAAALNKTRPIVTIHGPPGTGKTAVITEIVMEAVSRKQKVLICAPSNVAVNNVVNRLKGFTEICSLGIDSELSLSKELEQLEKFSDVQSLIRNLDSENDVVSEMNSNARKKIWHVANKMLWSLKESVLKNKQVVACTLTNNSLRFLREQGFHPNVTVIDEAAQTLECVAWYSLLLSPRAVVVGDPWQLPPVLKTSQSAERSKTGNSLMDTLSKRFDQSNSFMLTEQYRMNKKIMEWPSSFFYNSQLHSSELVSNQLLSDISDMPKGNLFDEPMIFLDTSCNKSSDNKEKSCRNSFINTFEARLVTKYITMLSACGVRKEDIGVIAPYAAQVGLLRNSIRTSKVNSVDAFQGQEREVVVMSLVRNNNEGRMGFLKDKRRLNVAVTRARRQFILIGNAAMMRHTKHTKSLFEYIQRHGVIVKPDHLTRFKPHIRNRP